MIEVPGQGPAKSIAGEDPLAGLHTTCLLAVASNGRASVSIEGTNPNVGAPHS